MLGPQGSGKGTQAKLLTEKFGYVLIGAGNSLREIAKTDTELGREVKTTIDAGHLVRPELISKVMREKIEALPAGKKIILDAYPRNLAQQGYFKEFWPSLGRGDFRVIFIELSEDEAVRRLGTRLTCENCGEIYIAGQAEKCKKCGGRLIERDDDKPEAVRQRLKHFNEETLPMIAEMEKAGNVVRIDGAPSIAEVQSEILKKLNLQ